MKNLYAIYSMGSLFFKDCVYYHIKAQKKLDNIKSG